MVNMLHRKIYVNDGFGVSKVMTLRLQTRKMEKPTKIFEDVKLEALLDKDDSQAQRQLAEQLDVTGQAVSN